MTIKSKLKTIFNLVGLTSIGANATLSLMIFFSIQAKGYCHCVEHNAIILNGEIIFAVFSAIYVIYIIIKAIKSNLFS